MNTVRSEVAMRASLRTLIVDDNSTNLIILERTLKHHFSHLIYCEEISKVNDGDEALLAFNSGHYDLILLDIDMPTLSGVDVARSIRETNEDIIIIACTTSDTPSARQVYKSVGMDGCVSKPLDLREVDEALLRALQTRTHLVLHTQVFPIARTPARFRTQHGSLPAITMKACQKSDSIPAILSESKLQDFNVLSSCYFQGQELDSLHLIESMNERNGSEIDSMNDSDASGESSSALGRPRAVRTASYAQALKRQRRAHSSSTESLSTIDLFDFPKTIITT